jgi:hypothetical protein
MSKRTPRIGQALTGLQDALNALDRLVQPQRLQA